MGRGSRGQSGIETMVLYGIFILVAGGAVILLMNMNLFGQKYVSKQKYGFSMIMPEDWAVYRDTDNVLIHVKNEGYEEYTVTGASVLINNEITCAVATTQPLLPDEGATLDLECPEGALADKFLLGAAYSAETTMTYMREGDPTPKESLGKFTGPVE